MVSIYPDRQTQARTEAQIHTLEAFGAFLIILLAAIVTAQTISAGSALSGSSETSLQNERLARDIVLTSAASGELKQAVLNWSGDTGFNGSVKGRSYYSSEGTGVPGGFGEALSSLDKVDASYNVYLVCDGERHPLIKNGGAGPNSASESVFVTLSDHDEVSSGTTLVNTPSYPCEDADTDSPFYSTVEVRVTVWSR